MCPNIYSFIVTCKKRFRRLATRVMVNSISIFYEFIILKILGSIFLFSNKSFSYLFYNNFNFLRCFFWWSLNFLSGNLECFFCLFSRSSNFLSSYYKGFFSLSSRCYNFLTCSSKCFFCFFGCLFCCSCNLLWSCSHIFTSLLSW